MSDFGLKDFGFIMPSYDDWRSAYYENARATFGSDVNIGDSSVIGQFLSIFAFQDIYTWQGLQAVYNSQTLNGAEGIYLDEILPRRGVFRKTSAAGNGYAFIKTNNTALWTTSIPLSTSFRSSGGQTYQVSIETALRDRIAAYTVTKSQLTAAGSSITFYITNVVSGALNTATYATNSSTLMTDLATFISSNVASSETSKVFVQNNTLYVGFNSTDLTNPVGLNSSVKFYATVNVGTKWSLIPVTATETGVYDVFPGGIVSITPSITGQLAVGNFTEFYPGRDVETDAEYRARFNDVIDESNAATRPAIYKAISDLDGVEKVRIYDNPTINDTPEAPAFTFNTVVLGGDPQEIATTLYNKKPINTLTSGTVSYNQALPDGGIEVIKYTPASETEYSIRVRYRTVDDSPLTAEEQTVIQNNFVNLASSFEIGTTIFNVQLQSVVFSSITFGRLSYLEVQTKKASDPDSSFSTSDITPAFSEIAAISTENVSFEQVI